MLEPHHCDVARHDSGDRVSLAVADAPRPCKRARALLSSTTTETQTPAATGSASAWSHPPPPLFTTLPPATQTDAMAETSSSSSDGASHLAPQGWRAYTRPHDWTPRRLVPHYDADFDQHHHEMDVTAEHALWCAYVRSGSRIPSVDLDIVFDHVVAFAGDFVDDDVYYDMESLEPGIERRQWTLEQSPLVQSDRERRSRLATVIGEALEREDDALSMSASPSWSGEDDIEAYASDDAASSQSS